MIRYPVAVVALLLTTLIVPASAFAEDSTTSATSPLRTRLEQLKQERQATRTAAQDQLQQRLETMRQTKEQARLEYTQRLQQLSDTRQQQLVSTINTALANINTRWTAHFTAVLNRLDLLTSKLLVLAQDQQNQSAIDSLNTIAQQITSTSAAVTEQAAKTYTVDLTDTTDLRTAAAAAHTQLRSDLSALRDSIVALRDSLHRVFLTLRPAVTSTPLSTP